MNIETTLQYNVDDGQRQFYVAYQPTAAEKAAGNLPEERMHGAQVAVETTVHEGRGKHLTLDANSFELVEQTTSLSSEDFYKNPEKITGAYYTEMAELFKKATGASYVHVFHHQVRARENNADGNGFNTTIQPYAYGVHSDSSAHHAEETFRAFADQVDKKYLKGRFMYINAWRNISDKPIENNSLAVCDESSLVKPDDYIGSDLYLQGYRMMQYRLSNRNASQHRWYYFSKMTKDEVLLFKQWDSDRTLPGRVAFHTAFLDPNARADAPDRESIECRGFAFFPDHEPNTCPTLPNLDVREGVGGDDAEVEADVRKVLGLIPTMNNWPSYALYWLLSTAGKKDGALQVAKTIVQDDGNYQGFKKYSDERKAKMVELVMKNDWEAKLVAKVAELKSTQRRDYSNLRTGSAWLAMGCVLGYSLARVLHSKI